MLEAARSGGGFNEGVTMRTGVLAVAMAITVGLVGCVPPVPPATDAGSGEWRCFDRSADSPVTLVALSEATGEVTAAGQTHEAEFKVSGINRRWDWGWSVDLGDASGAYRYAFVITPDGTGLYYDFALDDDNDGLVKQRDSFKCVPK